jgi:hypothetical protein
MTRFDDFAAIFKGPTGIAIAAIVVAVLYYTYESLQDVQGGTASGAAPESISGASEQLSAIPTGLNNITPSAQANGNPAPVGIWGLAGSVTNDLLGGAPQAFGSWIGEHVSTADTRSLTNQSLSGNPFGGGPSNVYADTVANAPTDATYAATPYVAPPA